MPATGYCHRLLRFLTTFHYLLFSAIITNQPINQSTNQPINQSINEPTKQSNNQSINQPIN
ncbi:MAG: hypothetical protein ACI8SJ_000267 [Shewanella sp.]|jgi:hypothetical protein